MTRLAIALAVLFLSAPASAQVMIGSTSYTTIAAAAAAAHDGDTVTISAGTYHEEVVWTANGLTIQGAGDVVIDRTGMPLQNQGGKGIFIVDGADFTVDGITFVGAHVDDPNPADHGENGAGIRWQGEGTLTVRHCVFRGNENGILGGNHPDNVALIENNEFVGNGLGSFGYTHSLYIGEIDTLTFRGNWSHSLAPGPDIGHLFKSRAHHNYVLYNRLTAESSHSSYELQLPEGGIGYVIGNLIEQSDMGPNRTIVSIGGDGMQWPDHHVFIVNNTIVNADTTATFIQATAPIDLDIVNNLFIGTGTVVSGGNVLHMTTNLTTDTSVLANAATFDYHLVAGSAAIDAGTDPGMDGTMSLVPMMEYAHPRATVARMTVGTIDIGAYEHGSMPMDDAAMPGVDGGLPGVDGGPLQTDAGHPRADAGTAPPATSGGCCGVAGARSSTGALTLAAMVLALATKRRRR